MERGTTTATTTTPVNVRKTHIRSTADLLTWPENLPPTPTNINSGSRSTVRTHQPSDGISKVLSGGQLTDEEAEALMKRKPCSGYKLKEMTGSGIFTDEDESAQEAGSSNQALNKTGLRIYQQVLSGISQISFNSEESGSPKKQLSDAKQRELSGTLESEEAKINKQLSDAKCKELSGHDIFGPPPEILPRPLDARNLELKGSIEIGEPTSQNIRMPIKVSNHAHQSSIMFSEETPIKTAKKIPNQKLQELTGNDIFKGDTPPRSTEKPLSMAKQREMSGSDIFADGKAASRDYLGGVRKPPGGESSIALV